MPHVNDQIPGGGTNFKGTAGKSSTTERKSSSSELDSTQPKFPRIEDCAHFHYETVDYGRVKVGFIEESSAGLRINGSLSVEGFNPSFSIRITCKDNTWVVRRSLLHFEFLDKWLHECIFDRRFSHLPTLKENELKTQTIKNIQERLQSYLVKLSNLTDVDIGDGGQISCAPVLHWLEMDKNGRNLAPHALGDVADINIPAIAAARVVRRYQAHDDDELSLNVGDMVSIIEMGATGWWRGKQGLKVGSFPAQCVRRINSPTDVASTHERPFSPPSYGAHPQLKPIARKHGKVMEFLRSFLDTRPSKTHLKKKGILRERVFSCDLGELLHRNGEDIPNVVKDCTSFVEKHGIVDGIYRISGVASHIRHLKYEFDSDRRPDLERDGLDLPKLGRVPGFSRENNAMCDPHSVAGLCKLFFRELPNPLLTYQLYNRFASAVTDYEAEERLLKVHDVIQQLPPPHYRTLKHLINHLQVMAQRDKQTSMHCRNLAIVWAPNLLRSREIEAGLAAFTEARVQSVVTEFLIVNGDLLFSEKLQIMQYDPGHKPPRPRSLMVLPTTKLISLEEAQARSKSGKVTPVSSDHADVTFGGVRLRHSGDAEKLSANERRKRHHKKGISMATALGASSPLPSGRGSRKQGHRHTASYSDPRTTPVKLRDSWTDENPRLSGSHGWKIKLGSLLKKSPQQSQPVTKQASLRRTQSDDSLVASHGPQRTIPNATSRPLGLQSSPLVCALACEEPILSDRRQPEPQVPHSSQKRSSTPARLQDNPGSPPRSQRQSRPAGGVYLENNVKMTDGYTFQITFRKLDKASKPSKDSLTSTATGFRSSSPFPDLTSDFPTVMGESGLDFDPMSYRLKNTSSLPKKESHHHESTERVLVKQEDSSRLDQNVTVSVKRMGSVQSLNGESLFAAVSTVVPPSSSCPEVKTNGSRRQEQSGTITTHSTRSALDSLTADFVVPITSHSTCQVLSDNSALAHLTRRSLLNENKSSNNNTKEQCKKTHSNAIDSLTADCISDVVQAKSTVRSPGLMTAAEKLGLAREATRKPRYDDEDKKPRPISKQKMPSDMHSCISGHVDETSEPSTAKTETEFLRSDDGTIQPTLKHDRNDVSRRISVQYYDVTNHGKGFMKRESYHGSFIALVGTTNETSAGENSTTFDPTWTENNSNDRFRKPPKTPDSHYSDFDPLEYDRQFDVHRRSVVSDQAQGRSYKLVSARDCATSVNQPKPVPGSSFQFPRAAYYEHEELERDEYYCPPNYQSPCYSERLDTYYQDRKSEDQRRSYKSPHQDNIYCFPAPNVDSRFTPVAHSRSQSDDFQLAKVKLPISYHTSYLSNPNTTNFSQQAPYLGTKNQQPHHPDHGAFSKQRYRYRSYSAIDDLQLSTDDRCLGFQKTEVYQAPPPGAAATKMPSRHGTGTTCFESSATAYDNRTYEKWYQPVTTQQVTDLYIHPHPVRKAPLQNHCQDFASFEYGSYTERPTSRHSTVAARHSVSGSSGILAEQPRLGRNAQTSVSYSNRLYEQQRPLYGKPEVLNIHSTEAANRHVVPNMSQNPTSLSWV